MTEQMTYNNPTQLNCMSVWLSSCVYTVALCGCAWMDDDTASFPVLEYLVQVDCFALYQFIKHMLHR